MDQSEWWANQKHWSSLKLYLLLSFLKVHTVVMPLPTTAKYAVVVSYHHFPKPKPGYFEFSLLCKWYIHRCYKCSQENSYFLMTTTRSKCKISPLFSVGVHIRCPLETLYTSVWNALWIQKFNRQSNKRFLSTFIWSWWLAQQLKYPTFSNLELVASAWRTCCSSSNSSSSFAMCKIFSN